MDFNGTDGFDYLDGTEGDDLFRPLTGLDTVIGRGGYDFLVANYVPVEQAYPTVARVDYSDGELSGRITMAVALNALDFEGIERLRLTLGAGDDGVALTASGTLAGVRLAADGGAGRDRLSLKLPDMDAVRFVVGSNGVATTSFLGTFSRFEQFSIDIGGGRNVVTTGDGWDKVSVGHGTSRITTRGGEDEIATVSMTDIVAAGAGTDLWKLDLSQRTNAVTLSRNGLAGSVAIAGGGRGSGVEWLRAKLGSGNDVVRLVDERGGWVDAGAGDDAFRLVRPNGAKVDGGAGVDALRIIAAPHAGGEALIGTDNEGALTGMIGQQVTPWSHRFGTVTWDTEFSGIERLNVTFGGGDDVVAMSAGALVDGGFVVLDAAGGSDVLRLSFGMAASATLTMSSDGVLRHGASEFRGFEQFDIRGTFGDDVLTGWSGDDVLDGAGGADLLSGGEGHDRFVFSSYGSEGAPATLADFVIGADQIELLRSGFGGLSDLDAGSLAASAFVVGDAATEASHRLIYDPETGRLYNDADGVGGQAQVLFAVLTGAPVLTAADIILV